MSGISGDVRSLGSSLPKADDARLEQMRQKIGTEFTSELKRDVSKKKNELGKDDFMKLMSVQLKYQDPLSPVKNEQMAAQLAQFSSLEQMVNMNTSLDKLAKAQKPSEHMIAASLIGKRVTTNKTHFIMEKNTKPEITFKMPVEAANVRVDVMNLKGEVVRKIELGQMAEGKQSIRWDGKNEKAQDQPLGEYSFAVLASDSAEKPIEVKSDSSGIVSGVTFEAGKSLLIVDGKKVPIETVGVIEADTPEAAKTAEALVGKTDAKAGAKAAVGAETSQPVNPMAASEAGNKQITSSATDDKKSSQGAKNNLPPDLSPEKIKSMLAGMGIKGEVADTEAESVPADLNQPAMPLWNPETN